MNERFKGIDVGAEWFRLLTEIGFRRMTRKEILAHIKRSSKKYPAKYLESVRKMSEGAEEGYACEVNNFTIIVWTSWMPSKQRFKIRDKIWPAVLLDPRNPDPFFAIPLHRVKGCIERTVRTARVYKEKVQKWQEVYTYPDSEMEIANEQFPLRYLLCKNPQCSMNGQKPTMLITDIALDDEEDNQFFAAPFKRYAKMRTRNIAKNIFVLPRRLWSWMHKHGVVVHRRRPYDDLEPEEIAAAKGFPDYNDLAHENDPGMYLDA
ncbi:MAG: hypothetical protein V4478_00190 [Patescibacteria group bacterium]